MMEQSHRTHRSFVRWTILLTLFFLVGGQAANAVWYPTYSHGEYMGCTHIPDPWEPCCPATYNMSYLGCLVQYLGDSLKNRPMRMSQSPAPTPGWGLADAADFMEQSGFATDSQVQAGMAANAAELRQMALSLQAAALDLMRTAQETEGLTTLDELESWATEGLEPLTEPVCSAASVQ